MSLEYNCALAADVVLFGFMPEEKLAVVLIQRKNPPHKDKWALPGGFISAAESFALIDKIDKAVAEKALRKLSLLQSQGKKLSFSLNLSGEEIESKQGNNLLLAKFETNEILANTDHKLQNIQHISVFPNPSYNEICINSNITDNSIIEIFNTTGTKVYETFSKPENKKINVSKYTPGIYMIKVQHKNTILVKKILIY